MFKKRLLSASREYTGMTFKVLDSAIVDDATWYTVSCDKHTSMWIRETWSKLEDDMWYEHIQVKTWHLYKNRFDIHEKLYTMLALKYAND